LDIWLLVGLKSAPQLAPDDVENQAWKQMKNGAEVFLAVLAFPRKLLNRQ
jgi:hypothetical protein